MIKKYFYFIILLALCHSSFSQTESDSSVNSQTEFFNNLRVFPNPLINGSSLYVDLVDKKGDLDLKIYTVTGKLVLKAKSNNINKVKLNVSSLSNGVYMLEIASKNKSVARKLVIMK